MDQIKIIFFDIDGTLIDMDRKIMSSEVETALIKLKENGVLLAIATGRPLSRIPVFEAIDFDIFLSFNGSLTTTKEGQTIYKNIIPKKDVYQLIDNATKINRPVSVATETTIGANGKDQDLIDYYAISKQEVAVVNNFDDLLEEDIFQIMLGCYKEEYDALLENVEGAKINAWWHRAIDVIPAGDGKGDGVRAVLEHFGLRADQSMAFGDGSNDLEMLQAVGVGVAMANATDDVKAVADEICGHVKDDGIYHYLLEKGMISL